MLKWLDTKLSWGSETSPLLLLWNESLNLARLSKNLQEILWKKMALSLSNSVVTLRAGLLGNGKMRPVLLDD